MMIATLALTDTRVVTVDVALASSDEPEVAWALEELTPFVDDFRVH